VTGPGSAGPAPVAPAPVAPAQGIVFPFRIAGRLRPILALFGVVRPPHAWVRLEPDRVLAQFGLGHADVPLANVERWDITGPYRWYCAVGIRSSPGRPEISFCGATHGAVRLFLRERQRAAWLRVTQLYLGVDDLDGFAAALRERGIPGEDLRAG
jgi:hypothetical protein